MRAGGGIVGAEDLLGFVIEEVCRAIIAARLGSECAMVQYQ